MTSTCRDCGVELTDENWYPSSRKNRMYICKGCHDERVRLWQKANPLRQGSRGVVPAPEDHESRTQRDPRNAWCDPFNENKACSSYLGVHVAERVLSHVFKNVEVMLLHNPGYDFICNKGKKIDVKGSCPRKRYNEWSFHIERNTTADYFLCLAFDNREDLNPLHAWLLPGDKFNHLTCTTISPSTINKWDEYRLDISKIRSGLAATPLAKIKQYARRGAPAAIAELERRTAGAIT